METGKPGPCAGMCRAHGIAHQKVTQRADLSKALKAAWALNKHSIVEVITQRDSNVEHHRRIQNSVKGAVLRALHAVVNQPPGGDLSLILKHCHCFSIGTLLRYLTYGHTEHLVTAVPNVLLRFSEESNKYSEYLMARTLQ